jgi:hypothetical protein
MSTGYVETAPMAERLSAWWHNDRNELRDAVITRATRGKSVRC